MFMVMLYTNIDMHAQQPGHSMTRYLVKIEQFRENYWGVISQEEDNACTYCKSLESIYVHIYTDGRNYYYTRGARSRLNR